MKRAIVFGVGNNYNVHELFLSKKYDIIGFVDNNTRKHGTKINGNYISSPETITILQYDCIIIMPDRPASEIMFSQLVSMGVPTEKIIGLAEIEAERGMFQHRSIFGEYVRPINEKLSSCVCRPTDLKTITRWKYCLGGINQSNMTINENTTSYIENRKTWEFVYICQSLWERGMLSKGKKGICFAVGKEPLPSIFASFDCRITATDAPKSISSDNWHNTNQHSDCINDLHYAHIIDREEFEQNVAFRYIDMNSIPDDESGYDFLWSACAIEHLGSIHAAKDFIYRAMNCLKPGGIAVHTTEYNLKSSCDTIFWGNVSVFRSIDLIDVAENLAWNGYRIEPLDFRLDGSEMDDFVAYPPYSEPHYKLFIRDSIVTSFGIIVYKNM